MPVSRVEWEHWPICDSAMDPASNTKSSREGMILPFDPQDLDRNVNRVKLVAKRKCENGHAKIQGRGSVRPKSLW